MSGRKDMSERVVALLRRARNDQDFRTILLRAAPDELSNLGLKPGQQAVLLSNLWLTSPFRPEDLPDWDARYGHAFSWVDYRSQAIPWTPFKTPFQHAKVAFITTAGLYRCEDSPFDTQDEEHGDPSYRIIPTETSPEALCVKHHLGLVEPGIDGDTNHLLPLRLGQQLQQEGTIGALAAEHYSFMGYIPHTQPLIERTAPEVALRLCAERVDAAILIPV
jgi:hypothetical protein